MIAETRLEKYIQENRSEKVELGWVSQMHERRLRTIENYSKRKKRSDEKQAENSVQRRIQNSVNKLHEKGEEGIIFGKKKQNDIKVRKKKREGGGRKGLQCTNDF